MKTKFGFEYANDDPVFSRALVAASNAYHEKHGGACQETYYSTGQPCPCAKNWRDFLEKPKPEPKPKPTMTPAERIKVIERLVELKQRAKKKPDAANLRRLAAKLERLPKETR